jgi:signal transduction histidine kinase
MEFRPQSLQQAMQSVGGSDGRRQVRGQRESVHRTSRVPEEDQLAHVFDRFYQTRTGDRRGAGLGLAIARGIIEAHDGAIRMESERGVGTTAWVELPLEPGPGGTQ